MEADDAPKPQRRATLRVESNIRSDGDAPWRVTVPAGTVIAWGPSGAGKTRLLQAITLALLGTLGDAAGATEITGARAGLTKRAAPYARLTWDAGDEVLEWRWSAGKGGSHQKPARYAALDPEAYAAHVLPLRRIRGALRGSAANVRAFFLGSETVTRQELLDALPPLAVLMVNTHLLADAVDQPELEVSVATLLAWAGAAQTKQEELRRGALAERERNAASTVRLAQEAPSGGEIALDDDAAGDDADGYNHDSAVRGFNAAKAAWVQLLAELAPGVDPEAFEKARLLLNDPQRAIAAAQRVLAAAEEDAAKRTAALEAARAKHAEARTQALGRRSAAAAEVARLTALWEAQTAAVAAAAARVDALRVDEEAQIGALDPKIAALAAGELLLARAVAAGKTACPMCGADHPAGFLHGKQEQLARTRTRTRDAAEAAQQELRVDRAKARQEHERAVTSANATETLLRGEHRRYAEAIEQLAALNAELVDIAAAQEPPPLVQIAQLLLDDATRTDLARASAALATAAARVHQGADGARRAAEATAKAAAAAERAGRLAQLKIDAAEIQQRIGAYDTALTGWATTIAALREAQGTLLKSRLATIEARVNAFLVGVRFSLEIEGAGVSASVTHERGTESVLLLPGARWVQLQIAMAQAFACRGSGPWFLLPQDQQEAALDLRVLDDIGRSAVKEGALLLVTSQPHPGTPRRWLSAPITELLDSGRRALKDEADAEAALAAPAPATGPKPLLLVAPEPAGPKRRRRKPVEVPEGDEGELT